jgi:hypothetical protein
MMLDALEKRTEIDSAKKGYADDVGAVEVQNELGQKTN